MSRPRIYPNQATRQRTYRERIAARNKMASNIVNSLNALASHCEIIDGCVVTDLNSDQLREMGWTPFNIIPVVVTQ